MIMIREFHLLQSVILKLEVITSTGAHTEICYRIETLQNFTQLSEPHKF